MLQDLEYDIVQINGPLTFIAEKNVYTEKQHSTGLITLLLRYHHTKPDENRFVVIALRQIHTVKF